MTVLETGAFAEWLRRLKDRAARLVISVRIRRTSGGLSGDSKSVGNGVSEPCIDYGPGYRVYYTKRGLEIIVLLCGSDKSTQSRDIEAARKMAKELQEAKP